MAKITTKAGLVLGTNYKFHLVDFQGIDIQVDATGSQILSTTTDFTSSSETAGIVKRAVIVGDIIKLSNTGDTGNEGVTLEVTVVAANALTYTIVTGTPVDEAAGADINVQAFKKTFEFLEAGGLSFVDGVGGITMASKFVDDWDTGDLDIYDKVFTSIEPRAKSLAALNGWEPHNDDTRLSIRDTAMEVRDSATAEARLVYGLPLSGELDEPTDQFTFWPPTDAELDAPTLAVTTGYINQLVLLRDVDNAIDNRGLWTFRCLEPGKTHLQETIDLQFAEQKPVASNNAIDPKLAEPSTGTQFVSDGTVSAGGIYASILLNVDVDSLYDGDVDSVLYSYKGYVDGDNQTNENVHTKIHWLLREAVNINSDGSGPDIRGDKAPPISVFSGDLITFTDYYMLNYDTAQRNFLVLKDLGGASRTWPSIFTLTPTAAQILVGGTFSVIHEDTFGLSSPTYLLDETSVVQQDIVIAASNPIVIAYSTYNVDGHTPNTPIPLRVAWNKPGSVEPDNIEIVMSASNQTVPMAPTSDPSYSAT